MDEQQQITQLFQLFLQFLIFINSNSNQFIYFLNNEFDTSINNFKTKTKDYISVIEFIQNKQINPQDFYSKFNEIDSVNMVHDYEYPLNSGICWNCKESFHHRCCAACKRILKFCDCEFICGLTIPTGQKDKQGKYTQFQKYKWYTSDNRNLKHDCIGMVSKNDELVLFFNERNFSNYPYNNYQRDKNCYK
ncbi:8220_t:CDS:1, partial [Gigaspora rosea]